MLGVDAVAGVCTPTTTWSTSQCDPINRSRGLSSTAAMAWMPEVDDHVLQLDAIAEHAGNSAASSSRNET
jgi:hypothetical protein